MSERYPSLRFKPGRILITQGASKVLEQEQLDPMTFICRHLTGDWGLACAEDAQANEEGVNEGYRIMSVYQTPGGQKVWIITEADRSATTLLLPDEY